MSNGYSQIKLEEVLSHYTEYIDNPESKIYPKLSVRLYGKGVVLDEPVDGALLKMKRHQIAKDGQVILSEIWGKKGAVGFVPSEGDGALCTSHFFLFDINQDRIEPGYLQAIFTANYLEPQLSAHAKGTTGYAAVRPKHLLAAEIPLPPLGEQRRIVAQIEALAARIAEARGLRQQVQDEQYAMLLGIYSRLTARAKLMPMSEVAPLIRRPVDIEHDELYRELGIRSFGNGTFHKSPTTGFELGSKRVFQIEPGDLLFSNVFAWEGAIAVAKSEDKGRIGSHRFITCVPKDGVATAHFLCFHFLTPQGLYDIGQASPGGAGRNRTLGLEKLAQIMVPVPDYEKQVWFDDLYARVDALKRLQAETAAELDALLPAVLDRAFRGEL